METVESINLITRKPDVRGGRPCIIGTGLKVSDIVMAMRYHDRFASANLGGLPGFASRGIRGAQPTINCTSDAKSTHDIDEPDSNSQASFTER